MPSKKKYNARFAPARIKKIMQSDEEVGKVSAAVPVIISKALEMFLESFLDSANQLTTQRSAKTLTPQHLKLIIQTDKKYDFLKDLVANVPDLGAEDEDDEAKEHVVRKRRKPTLPDINNGNPIAVASTSSTDNIPPTNSSLANMPSSSSNHIGIPFSEMTAPPHVSLVTTPTSKSSNDLFPNMPT